MMVRGAIVRAAAVLIFIVLADKDLVAQTEVASEVLPRPRLLALQPQVIENCASYRSVYSRHCLRNSSSRDCVELERYIASRCRM